MFYYPRRFLKNALLSFKKTRYCSLFLTQYNVENQKKLKAVVINIVWDGGGGGKGREVRQVRLYSRLARAQKSQKCKFVTGHLSMIVVRDTCTHCEPIFIVIS